MNEIPDDFRVWTANGPVTEEQRQKLWLVFDDSIDKFLEAENDEELDHE